MKKIPVLTFLWRSVLKFGVGRLVSGAVSGRHTSWPHTTDDGSVSSSTDARIVSPSEG